MKMSINVMICGNWEFEINLNVENERLSNNTQLTLSCFKSVKSFISRNVRFANTDVENGFRIFLMATFVLVVWSLAALERF